MLETTTDDSRDSETLARRDDPFFVGVKEVAARLGLSTREVYRLIDREELTEVRQGRRRQVDYPSLIAYRDRIRKGRAAA